MATPPTASSTGNLILLTEMAPSHSSNMMGHKALGPWQSHFILLPSPHDGEGSSFPGSASPSDTVNPESVVQVKPGDSGVVIKNQVDAFAPGWQSVSFLSHTFILVSEVRFPHLPTSHLNRL